MFLFQTNSNIVLNAYPNWRRSYYSSSDLQTYSVMYKNSADELISLIGDNYDKRADEVILPVLFLYRHSLELILKAILLTHYLMDDNMSLEKIQEILTDHNIESLWRKAENIIPLYLKDSIKKDREPLKIMQITIMEMHENDPSSMMFRYPFNKEYKVQKIGNEEINYGIDYNQLQKNFGSAYSYFDGWFNTLFNVYENLDVTCTLE